MSIHFLASIEFVVKYAPVPELCTLYGHSLSIKCGPRYYYPSYTTIEEKSFPRAFEKHGCFHYLGIYDN